MLLINENYYGFNFKHLTYIAANNWQKISFDHFSKQLLTQSVHLYIYPYYIFSKIIFPKKNNKKQISRQYNYKMNDSSHSFNMTREEQMSILGSSLAIDSLFMYSNTIVSVLGVFFNILSFLVLQSREFNMPIYEYLRVYTLNSAIVCTAASTFIFSARSSRIHDWKSSYWATTYFAFVCIPLMSTGYFYATFLDIFLSIDRISNFNQKIKGCFSRYGAYKTSAFGLLICVLINSPCYYMFEPLNMTVAFNSPNLSSIYLLSWRNWTTSYTGAICMFFFYMVRDLGFMIIEMIISVMSFYYLKKCFANKSALILQNLNASAARRTSVIFGLHFSALSSLEHKLTFMILSMCAISALEQISVLVLSVYPFFAAHSVSSFYFFLRFLAHFSIVVKHASNFFLFFAFNQKFRKVSFKFILNRRQ